MKTIHLAIRHYDEPYYWPADLLAKLVYSYETNADVTYAQSVLAPMEKTSENCWQWLSLALEIDCDYLIHIDCDTEWIGKELDLGCLDTDEPTILAGDAVHSQFSFSTGVMSLNRPARELLLSYLSEYKPAFPLYFRGKDKAMCGSADKGFSRLSEELGIKTVLTDQIQWRWKWTQAELDLALEMPGVCAIANYKGGFD